MVLTRVDMGEAVIEDGTSWYVSAGFTSNGVFSSCKALKEVVMPVAEEAAHLVSMEKAFANYLVRFMKGGKVSGAAKLLCNE